MLSLTSNCIVGAFVGGFTRPNGPDSMACLRLLVSPASASTGSAASFAASRDGILGPLPCSSPADEPRDLGHRASGLGAPLGAIRGTGPRAWQISNRYVSRTRQFLHTHPSRSCKTPARPREGLDPHDAPCLDLNAGLRAQGEEGEPPAVRCDDRRPSSGGGVAPARVGHRAAHPGGGHRRRHSRQRHGCAPRPLRPPAAAWSGGVDKEHVRSPQWSSTARRTTTSSSSMTASALASATWRWGSRRTASLRTSTR